MLIMQATNVDFQGHAENIAADFFDRGTSLVDGIVKVAKDNSFTPEEIKRLTEKTNTQASIRFLKTAEDKKATFTLADYASVLALTHPMTEEKVEKTASVYKGLPNTRKKTYGPLFEKKAAEEVDPASKIDGMRAIFTVRREIEQRQLEKVALEQRLSDRLDWLASEFCKWRGPDFTKYASECLAVFGRKAEPAIDNLAKYLNVQVEKTAADGIVDDTTKPIQAMREICDGLDQLVKIGNEIKALCSVRDNLVRGARNFYRC